MNERLQPSQRPISLRTRLLLPLLVASLIATAAVTAMSFWLGKRWAQQDVTQRFQAVVRTVRPATFPLTPTVLELLGDLTRAELVTLDERGKLRDSTLGDVQREAFRRQIPVAQSLGKPEAIERTWGLELAGTRYLSHALELRGAGRRPQGPRQLLVLFNESEISAASRRAALLPLATGISTILALTTLSFGLSRRLIVRIQRLQGHVQRVATGEFHSRVDVQRNDEIGRLGLAVNRMAGELEKLWQTVRRQQSEQLLHQVAGAMAHQLRNTLTGSRMAMELHRRQCNAQDLQAVDIAVQQLEQAEQYVRRLLLASAGRQARTEPARLADCVEAVRQAQSAIAKHLRVDLSWEFEADALDGWVGDGATWNAAISNLILNAMQVANEVAVRVGRSDAETLELVVGDNGPGVAADMVESIFEPFVTTKPEGLGLGLPLVRRAAETLGGSILYRRSGARTEFIFRCRVFDESPA